MKPPVAKLEVNDNTPYKATLDLAVASADSGYGHSGEQIFRWMVSWGKEGELASALPDIRPIR